MVNKDTFSIKSAWKRIQQIFILLSLGQLYFFDPCHSEVARDNESDHFVEESQQSTEYKSNHKSLINRLINEYGEYDLSLQMRSYYSPKKRFVLFDHLTSIYCGGSIKTDYYMLKHATTLDKTVEEDNYNQFRVRPEISFRITRKMDKFRDLPVAEGQFTIGNTMFGRVNQHPRSADSLATYGAYDQVFPPVQAHMQEAWLKVNFDQIFSNNEPAKISVKAGFFPFLVGRGISLGDWFNGGSHVYGFSKTSVEMHAPKYPAGVLLSGGAYKNSIKCDLYYSPSVSEEVYPPNQERLYKTNLTTSSVADRHIVAGRVQVLTEFYEKSKTVFEPYFVYYNSPRHTMFTNYDSSLRLLTLGFMVDHKSNGFELNLELAKQFGRLRMNEYINLARPDYTKFLNGDRTFITAPRANLFKPYPQGQYVQDGESVVDSTGSLITPGTAAGANSYYALPQSFEEWQNEAQSSYVSQRFFEYHPTGEIELTGKMAVADIRYTFDDYPLRIAAGMGYFSGDKYPFNDSIDEFIAEKTPAAKPSHFMATRTRSSFLPLRDYHYTGLWAKPIVMFNAGIIPRPYNISYQDKIAYNEQNAATNLVYICGGFTISPTNDIDKFYINPNMCLTWTHADAPVWDKESTQQPKLITEEENYLANNSLLIVEKDATLVNSNDRAYKALKGWEGSRTANKFLGWEVNCILSYHISSNLELMIKGGVFVPGQFYSDIANQPNQNTLVTKKFVNPNGTYVETTENKGLGNDTSYGINIRLGYKF